MDDIETDNGERSPLLDTHDNDGAVHEEVHPHATATEPSRSPSTPTETSSRPYAMAACLPVLCIPTLLLWQFRGSTDAATMVWVYILTGTLGMAIFMVIQSVLAYLAFLLLFGSDTNWGQPTSTRLQTRANDHVAGITRGGAVPWPL